MELQEIVNRLLEGNLTIKRVKLSQSDALTIISLPRTNRKTFIQKSLKELFDKCGITTQERDIGWEVIEGGLNEETNC